MENTHLYSFPTKWNGTNRIHIAQSIPLHISIIVSCISSEWSRGKKGQKLVDRHGSVILLFACRIVSVAMYSIRSATQFECQKFNLYEAEKSIVNIANIFFFANLNLLSFTEFSFPSLREHNKSNLFCILFFSTFYLLNFDTRISRQCQLNVEY